MNTQQSQEDLKQILEEQNIRGKNSQMWKSERWVNQYKA